MLKSNFVICVAYSSQSFLLKLKTITGAKFRSMIILTILNMSLWLGSLSRIPPLRPRWSPLAASPEVCSTAIAVLKLSSLKVPYMIKKNKITSYKHKITLEIVLFRQRPCGFLDHLREIWNAAEVLVGNLCKLRGKVVDANKQPIPQTV